MFNKNKKNRHIELNNSYAKPRNNDMLTWYASGLVQFQGQPYMEMTNMIGLFDEFQNMEYNNENIINNNYKQ